MNQSLNQSLKCSSSSMEDEKDTNFLENELQVAQRAGKQLSAELSQQRMKNRRLAEDVRAFKGSEQGYIFYLEQMRMRAQPFWWWLLIAASFVCVFGSYSSKHYGVTFINIVAHKMLWRRAYVETNAAPQLFAIVIMAITFLWI